MHPHRSSALGYASAASAAHSRVYGACAAEAAASETSGLSVGGCIRARGYFRSDARLPEVDGGRLFFTTTGVLSLFAIEDTVDRSSQVSSVSSISPLETR